MTEYSPTDNPESSFTRVASLKPQGDFNPLTLAKWIMLQTQSTDDGDNDLESILTEINGILDHVVSDDVIKRIQLAVGDIIVGEKVVRSWGAVNASGAEGGMYYSQNPTLEEAKTATYSAPSLQSPNGGAFYVARIPVDADPRNYTMREPSTHFGDNDVPVNQMTLLGSDENWSYYEERVRFFGNITLRRSTHRVGVNTWGGKLGSTAEQQVQEIANELETILRNRSSLPDANDFPEGEIILYDNAWYILDITNGNKSWKKWQAEATQNLEDKLDAVDEDLVILERAVSDIVVHTKTKSLGLRNVNSNGSEGGIAFASTWTLTTAQAATYTAPTVAAAAATGAALFRIPTENDARKYQVNIAGLGSDTLSHLAIRVFHDDDYTYWEAANFQGEFAVSLQYNPQQVTVTTEYDGELGDKAIASFGAKNRTLLMSKTDTAANWSNSSAGQNLPAGVNKLIFDGFSGTKEQAWSDLVINVKYTESGNPAGTDHFGSIHMGTQLGGGQTSDNQIKIYGTGRIDGADLHARIDLPQRTSFNSTTGKILIEGASFALTGNERLEVKMWGIK